MLPNLCCSSVASGASSARSRGLPGTVLRKLYFLLTPAGRGLKLCVRLKCADRMRMVFEKAAAPLPSRIEGGAHTASGG